MSFQTPITIKEAIENIENNKYLLPAIQREFVWSAEQIEWLFDSIMKGYPISSFLFWRVESKTKNEHKFYKFLNEYRERFKTHNEEISTDGLSEFYAILDGQQRLTSLYIGLKGSYAYKLPRKWWDDTEENIPTRHLYLNITNKLEDTEDGREYEFKFLKKQDTKEQELYTDNENKIWFKVGKILDFNNFTDFSNFLIKNNFNNFQIDILSKLQQVIHSDRLINYYLEKEQDYDKALNIFIRINSGGEPLNFSDLLISIAVAHWSDAREEIRKLVDNIRDKGFSIPKDFILKTFLYLYSKDIRFKVKNFNQNNVAELKKEWQKIRETILEVFDLIKSFGFTDYTLTSKNALLPIIYYIYHRNIYKNFTTKQEFKKDREIIRKWLHIMLLKQIFGGQADNVLSQIRSGFTDDFENIKINKNIIEFPVEKINKKIKKDISVGDEFLEDLLCTQKDDKYAFSILALLYPHLDYKNNNFHKDHLHPKSIFTKKYIESLNIDKEVKEKYYIPCVYNGIYNLQMLDANENMSKNDKTLKEWVEEETKNKDREKFLEEHLIPDVDLSIENFPEFIDKRKELLLNKLREILK